MDLQPGTPMYQALKHSLEQFGYVLPLIWNERTGNLIGGHQRFKILHEQGIQRVDCSVVDLDSQQEKTLNIALNKIEGSWDDQRLAALFEELEDHQLQLTGFEPDEMTQVLNSVSHVEFSLTDELENLTFNYEEQYGVIVRCTDEKEQEHIYQHLSELGYVCKVVSV